MTHETDKRISFEIDFNELFITLIPQLLLFYVSSVYKREYHEYLVSASFNIQKEVYVCERISDNIVALS